MDGIFDSEQALINNLMEEEDHSFYWESRWRFFQNEELDNGMGFDDPIADYYGSSSPEGGTTASFSSPTGASGLPKNIVMERKRRQLVNERLYALRGVVPNITKMDKASIIKDAIDYIQLLQEQEKRMSAEISQLEMINMTKAERVALLPICHEDAQVLNFEKGKKRTQAKSTHLAKSPIEVIKLKVNQTGEKTLLVSISCSKKEETMTKICELFEILNLKVMTANITSVSTSLLHTMLVESNEMNSTQVKEKMEGAIAELNAQNSPVTSMSV